MKRILIKIGVLFTLLFCQNNFASSGLFFDVAATGTPEYVSIRLCLNGNGPVSCQNYTVSALTLTLVTTIPNHVYPYAGIKINTPGFKIGNLGADCTPTANGYCLFSISNTSPKTITLAVTGALPISPTTLPNATRSTAYSQTVVAGGGVSPYTYTISSGTLPTGLSLNASTGIISGVPTLVGTYHFTITATDSNANTGSQAYSVNVITQLFIQPPAIPPATVNLAYSITLSAIGGVAPYTYEISSGSLPAGISLNPSTGVISGTPSSIGFSSFTVKATSSNARTGFQSYLFIVSGPSISPASLTAAVVNTAYTTTFSATGGFPPYTFTISSGSLPAGLSLSTSGVLSGTPTVAGQYQFTVSAEDTNGNIGARSYTFDVYIPMYTFSTLAGVPSATGDSFNSLWLGATPNMVVASLATSSPGCPNAVGNSSFSIAAEYGTDGQANTSWNPGMPGASFTGQCVKLCSDFSNSICTNFIYNTGS